MNITLISHKYGVSVHDPCCYPLGFLYISAVLKKAGHTVKILNYNLWDYDLRKELAGQDIAMFTGFEEFLPLIQKDSAICKELGVKTVVGGALATFKPELMAEYCDLVLKGEAEATIIDVLSKKGVIDCGIVNLDKVPFPDYEGFGIEEYNKRHSLKYMGVLTSRGCPHKCTFCSHTCNFQYRKLDDVFSEIDLYRENYGVELIVFNDNTFNTNKNRVIKISQGMESRGIKWSAAFRLDILDNEMCRVMKSSCLGVIVGVESFNQQTLDAMQKRISVEQIVDGLNLLHKHNIPYYGNVLFGWGGQTSDDIRNDLSIIPGKYNLFPALVRPFIGTTSGKTSLSGDEWLFWDRAFKENVASRGKYCYPDLGGI